MGTKFRTMLAPIGLSTGDGRRFAEGAIELTDVPFPFEWARSREGGHDGAVVVGAVQEAAILTVKDALAQEYIFADNAKGLDKSLMAVWARGELFDGVDREDMPRLAEDVAEAMHLMGAGTLGPSVDLDSFEAVPVLAGTDEEVTWERYEEIYEETGEEPAIELLVTAGRVRAATLVSIPAFAETARPLELIVDDSALVASVTGATSLPIADTGTAWDGSGAARRVFDHFTDGDTVDTAGVAKAFLYRDPDADASTQAAYKLGFADIIDGELTIVPRGVAATAGGRGVNATKGIPDDEKTKIKNKVCTLYSKIRSKFEDWPECPFDRENAASLIASVSTVAGPLVSAFSFPELDRPTPITWDFTTGRVFGHIATWQTCHVGYADVCVTAPKDSTGEYAWFNRFSVETEDGGTIWAGRITVGGRHPGLSLTAAATMAQYDGKTVAADVRAYTDTYGIVVAGVIRPGLDDSTRSVLARCKVSGDWRETPAGLSLVEILALSPGSRRHAEPGFPIPGTFSRAGRQVALTAALGPDPELEQGWLLRSSAPLVDVEALADALEHVQAARTAVRTARADLVAVVEPVLTAQIQANQERAERERAALAALMGAGVDG